MKLSTKVGIASLWGSAKVPEKVSRDMGYCSDSIAVSRDMGPLSMQHLEALGSKEEFTEKTFLLSLLYF